jgi:hypothetical protein
MSTTTITDQIKAAIEKDLPNQIGKVLQERFAELEKIEADHIKLQKKHSILINDHAQLAAEKNALFQRKQDWETLESRASAYELAVLKFDVQKEIKTNDVKNAEGKVDMLNNLVGLFVSNPQAITHMNKNVMHTSQYNSQTGDYEMVPTNEDTIVTTTEDKPGAIKK